MGGLARKEVMGSREFEYEPEAICDGCGAKGAFDIYGDYLCPECLTPKKKRRPTQPAPDAGDSAASSGIVNASADTTSQTETKPTQRG